jgi:DNA-binding MarR family transcriptional regulator
LNRHPVAAVLERHKGERDPRQVFASITERELERLAKTTSTHLAGVRRRYLSRLSKTQTQQLMNIWDQLLSREPESDSLQMADAPKCRS